MEERRKNKKIPPVGSSGLPEVRYPYFNFYSFVADSYLTDPFTFI